MEEFNELLTGEAAGQLIPPDILERNGNDAEIKFGELNQHDNKLGKDEERRRETINQPEEQPMEDLGSLSDVKSQFWSQSLNVIRSDYSMGDKQQATKRSAQNLNKTHLCTPSKPVKSKIQKPNTPDRRMEEKEEEKEIDMREIQQMFTIMMGKLEKLDGIEADMKEIKHSLEYAHAEIADLKRENETTRANQEQARTKLEKLEKDNATLRDKIVDIQARSMRDNLLFFNIPEQDKEITTEIIHNLLETKFQIKDAKEVIKIDRSHRIGKKREGNRKPRPIVVKFNYHQDREHVRLNAKKLKGTNIGVSEQFPEEIESVRKALYPELKKAKAEGKRAKLVRDKLIVEGQVFNNKS
ncbi:Hypothetical predicted protein [Paramuricea clavata]|uniref:Uncharacterized protein n=1 Tax=Paramuricea clavata TaxID=317549 RepID=A0A7D9DJX8_PARCT|nr:Hypothetical predicted protein [Paramuricea clavata]